MEGKPLIWRATPYMEGKTLFRIEAATWWVIEIAMGRFYASQAHEGCILVDFGSPHIFWYPH